MQNLFVNDVGDKFPLVMVHGFLGSSQYANVGQGILAGVAILFVALILDRVVQGKKRV